LGCTVEAEAAALTSGLARGVRSGTLVFGLGAVLKAVKAMR